MTRNLVIYTSHLVLLGQLNLVGCDELGTEAGCGKTGNSYRILMISLGKWPPGKTEIEMRHEGNILWIVYIMAVFKLLAVLNLWVLFSDG